MCKNRRDTLASEPKSRASRASATGSSFPTDTGSYNRGTTTTTTASSSSSSSSATSRSSLATLRGSLPERPILYPFAEIRSATNNFHSKSHPSSSSSSWRCNLRGRDAVVFQRPFRGDPSALPARLATVSRSHHSSLVRLLGASLAGNQIYLTYEYAAGASLAECLRNPRNPNFTPLSSWVFRMQIAADLAQGLEYIHCQSATIHNRLKSSSVIVTDPDFRAKICHFGAADLAGEIPAASATAEETSEIIPIPSDQSKKMRPSRSRRMRIEGTMGYMAPEVLAGGDISQRSDVFALGVVLLELLAGEEPVKCRFDEGRRGYKRATLIETAREAMGAGDDEAGAEERRRRIRRWVDRRLRDSFPVEAAESLIRVALRCVEAEASIRPDVTWVAGMVSKLLLDSQAWGERVRVPVDFSVSFAPR